jgi:hypothetical protein
MARACSRARRASTGRREGNCRSRSITPQLRRRSLVVRNEPCGNQDGAPLGGSRGSVGEPARHRAHAIEGRIDGASRASLTSSATLSAARPISSASDVGFIRPAPLSARGRRGDRWRSRALVAAAC